MRTTSYYKGHEIGWGFAGAYIEGGKVERRRVRAYLERTQDVSGPFLAGFRDAFADRVTQRAAAIREGRAPRSIRPAKLEGLLARY